MPLEPVQAPLSPPLEWLDEMATRFEAAWQTGAPPNIADFIHQAPTEFQPALLQELVLMDMEYRLKKKCLRSLDEYVSQFPILRGPDNAPPSKLVEFDKKIRTGSETIKHPPVTSASSDDSLPAHIGKYQVLGKLDEGGQGEIYLSYHPHLRKEVVIKLSRPGKLDSVEQKQIQDEGRILAGLDHPNLARVYDLDFHEGRVFLVMEYVRGPNLAQHARAKRIAPRQAAFLVARTARAVEAIHKKDITHQDLKPQNILVDDKGQPRLIDFGLARHCHAWVDEARLPQGGTVAYMAPEQGRADGNVGPPSDVFALGGTLFFLLTGQAPFTAEDRKQALQKVQRCDFDRTVFQARKVPARLAKICLRAMAAMPEDRPSADQFAASLERYLLWVRTRALIAFSLTLLIAGVAIGLFLASRQPPEEPAFSIQVWRNEKSADLASKVPLKSGDELKARLKIPANLHAALCLVNGNGKLVLLEHIPPRPEPFELAKSFRLAGPSGSEFVFACLGQNGPIEEKELRSIWEEKLPWPALPSESVLRVDLEKVRVEHQGRDLVSIGDRSDPQEEVKNRLEDFRRNLRQRFDHVVGLAFFHR